MVLLKDKLFHLKVLDKVIHYLLIYLSLVHNVLSETFVNGQMIKNQTWELDSLREVWLYLILCLLMILLFLQKLLKKLLEISSTTGESIYRNGKSRCNNLKVVAINTYCNDNTTVAIRCKNLHGNRLLQQQILLQYKFRYNKPPFNATVLLLQSIFVSLRKSIATILLWQYT